MGVFEINRALMLVAIDVSAIEYGCFLFVANL
jgi:hypothetical protein